MLFLYRNCFTPWYLKVKTQCCYFTFSHHSLLLCWSGSGESDGTPRSGGRPKRATWDMSTPRGDLLNQPGVGFIVAEQSQVWHIFIDLKLMLLGRIIDKKHMGRIDLGFVSSLRYSMHISLYKPYLDDKSSQKGCFSQRARKKMDELAQ